MIRHAYVLALRYLAAHPVRSVVLVLGATVALALPALTLFAADRVEERLLDRATATPILIGKKGNEFDLTMSSLYFRGHVRDTLKSAVADDVMASGYGLAVPLYVSHTTGGAPLVGTTLEYFDARGLTVAQGRMPAVLAEVVVGASAAQSFHLSVGDNVRSDLSNLYNISGAYPLVLTVVGVLERSGTPDDQAFFADVKTTWAIDGHLHGHDEVDRSNVLNPQADDGENLEATAAIFMISEITDANRASFHLHGGVGELPVSAVLVFPTDHKAHDQLLGDYALHETLQAVRPTDVVQTILGIVLQVRDGLVAYFFLVAMSTLAFLALVLSLSLRLRQAELVLMRRIGSSRYTITAMVIAELSVILGVSMAASALITWGGLAMLEFWLPG